jgi:hypothetical protein
LVENWSYQIEEDEMDWTCSTNGRNEKGTEIIAGNPEEDTSLGRHGHRLENNVVI